MVGFSSFGPRAALRACKTLPRRTLYTNGRAALNATWTLEPECEYPAQWNPGSTFAGDAVAEPPGRWGERVRYSGAGSRSLGLTCAAASSVTVRKMDQKASMGLVRGVSTVRTLGSASVPVARAWRKWRWRRS